MKKQFGSLAAAVVLALVAGPASADTLEFQDVTFTTTPIDSDMLAGWTSSVDELDASGCAGDACFTTLSSPTRTTKTVSLPSQAIPVAKPQSYALLLAGLGVVGFVARRRNKP